MMNDTKAERGHALSTGQLLLRTSKLARERMRTHLKQLGLHRGQGFILWRLSCEDGLAQGELARSLNITPATVSGALARMEQAGWVKRRSDPHDQRVTRVFLSEEGRKLQKKLAEAFRALEDELLAALTPDEETQLRETLEKLYVVLRGQHRQVD